MSWGNPEDRRIEGLCIKGDCTNIKNLLAEENIKMDSELTNKNMRIDVYENTVPLLQEIIFHEELNRIDFIDEDKLSYYVPEFICIINPDIEKLNNVILSNTNEKRLAQIFCFADIQSCKDFIMWWYMRFTVEIVWRDCDYSLQFLESNKNNIKVIKAYDFSEVCKNTKIYTKDFFSVAYYNEKKIEAFLKINEHEKLIEQVLKEIANKNIEAHYEEEGTYQSQYPTFKRFFFAETVLKL